MNKRASHQEQQLCASYHEVEVAKKITIRDIKEHMTGPIVSLIFHAIAIAFFGSIIIFDPREERRYTDLEVEMILVEVKELQELPEPPPTEEVSVEQEVEIERPDVVADVQVEVDDAPMVDAIDMELPSVLVIAPHGGALVLPGVMSSRSGRARTDAIDRHGGSAETEAAIKNGLRWLRDNQNPDGSWGKGRGAKPFLTGIALLAFFAYGETPFSQEFGACVLKAIMRLVDMVDTRDKKTGLLREDRETFGHALVAHALSEAYALTRIPKVKTAMNTMLESLVKGQQPCGGYDHHHTKADRFDLPFSGWHFQALSGGLAAGSTVAGLEQAIAKAIKGLKEMSAKDGGFYYSTTEKRDEVGSTSFPTAIGALCLLLMTGEKSREVSSAIKWLQEANDGELMRCDWKGIDNYKDVRARHWPLYLWYHQTQAFFQYTGGTGSLWKTWNREFSRALVREQAHDGRWTSPYEKYSKHRVYYEPREGVYYTFREAIDLDIYSTALCCLMLSVYYRFLPTFKIVSGSAPSGRDGGGSVPSADTTGLIIE